MFPTERMKEHLAFMNFKSPEGKLSVRDHLLRQPLVVEKEGEIKACFNSGGAGIFAKPQEYCRKQF